MKIFLGMPKTDTRAGWNSLPPCLREGTPAVLCVTSEIAVISRWPPLVLLSSIYFLRRFLFFLSSFTRSRAQITVFRTYTWHSNDMTLSLFTNTCVFFFIDQSVKKRNFAIDYRSITSLFDWRRISWEPVGISGLFVRLLRSISILGDIVGEASFENPRILKES